MATGDLNDIASRIRAVLPQPWFPAVSDSNTPVLDGVLAGLAWPWAMMYMMLSYAKNQSRIDTSSGNFVDFAAQDYFGATLPRVSDETDASYIARIKENFFTKRNTRPAFDGEMADQTGIVSVREPWRASDCGCYGNATYANQAARYGSRTSAGCVFVEVSESANISSLAATFISIKSEGIDVFLVQDVSASS
ncbi:hypothetical protein [Acetobacter conturbans]|uniref:Uncharacterized protein n=1 Tax=Acetobacter conturbans TaxID=1737472 RepID=A0ABX0K3F6_9PROT|nr:hypothetical protein [Acetobacter conturbans]NHN89188.1 hypothetical protein [Acetobacter conturbans]